MTLVYSQDMAVRVMGRILCTHDGKPFVVLKAYAMFVGHSRRQPFFHVLCVSALPDGDRRRVRPLLGRAFPGGPWVWFIRERSAGIVLNLQRTGRRSRGERNITPTLVIIRLI